MKVKFVSTMEIMLGKCGHKNNKEGDIEQEIRPIMEDIKCFYGRIARLKKHISDTEGS